MFCELCIREFHDDGSDPYGVVDCYGCGAVICSHCYEKGGLIDGRHEPEDHLFSETEREELLYVQEE